MFENELDVARAMRDKQLPSPQRVANHVLFDLRVTGTGHAYRDSVKEFVFRDPADYLNPEFLERCNGLPVLWQHQDTGEPLDSDQFAKRIIGTVTLPYVQGDEVWGIARIYDETAIEAMCAKQLSTSPMTVSGGKSYDVGTQKLLMEDSPMLIDSVAVCPLGVWDKSAGPRGVRVDNPQLKADHAAEQAKVDYDHIDPRIRELETELAERKHQAAKIRQTFGTDRTSGLQQSTQVCTETGAIKHAFFGDTAAVWAPFNTGRARRVVRFKHPPLDQWDPSTGMYRY